MTQLSPFNFNAVRITVRNRVLLTIPFAAVLLFRSTAEGQSALGALERPRFAVGGVGGVSQFDLSGTGSARVIGLRAETELKSWLVAEGALGTFRPGESLGFFRYYIPEAQLQVQIPTRIVRPYIGAGGGYFVGTEGRQTRGTASLAAGMRVPLSRFGVDARGELRIRGIGSSFGGSTAEWTLGLAYRFNR